MIRKEFYKQAHGPCNRTDSCSQTVASLTTKATLANDMHSSARVDTDVLSVSYHLCYHMRAKGCFDVHES